MAFGGGAFTKQTAWRLGAFSAVALWLPPNVSADSDAMGATFEQSVAPEQHLDLFAVIDQMSAAHPHDPHWYLPWFGVDPLHQGRGVGSRLMEHCLRIVDGDRLPAFLESPNPRNLSFYERHGFTVVATSGSGSCPPVFSMSRPAR